MSTLIDWFDGRQMPWFPHTTHSFTFTETLSPTFENGKFKINKKEGILFVQSRFDLWLRKIHIEFRCSENEINGKNSTRQMIALRCILCVNMGWTELIFPFRTCVVFTVWIFFKETQAKKVLFRFDFSLRFLSCQKSVLNAFCLTCRLIECVFFFLLFSYRLFCENCLLFRFLFSVYKEFISTAFPLAVQIKRRKRKTKHKNPSKLDVMNWIFFFLNGKKGFLWLLVREINYSKYKMTENDN